MEQEQNETLLERFEVEIRQAGNCTVIDFLKEFSLNEFEMEHIRHNGEWDNLLQKIQFRSTIERRTKLLNDELDSTIDYLESNEEGELRYILGDLSQTKLDKAIDRIKTAAQVFMKSSEWKSLDYKQKQQFLAIKNLRSDLIKEDMPFQEAYRILLGKIGLKILTEKEKKKENTTLNRQVLGLIKGLFYDHFQVELNRKIQNELKKYLPKSDYELAVVVDEEEQQVEQSGIKIDIFLPKIKERRGNDTFTSLSLTQTAVFFNMLRQEKVIFKDESYQTKENIYKAIQVLTGYSRQTLKVAMNISRPEETDKVVTLKMFEKLSRC
jgi:hypothetical protein